MMSIKHQWCNQLTFPDAAKLDEELTKFFLALRDATVVDVGNGMQQLSLGPGSHFPDDKRRRSDLMVRDFYLRLFQRVEAEPNGASLLTGVPGTGKSWWIWYAMHLLLTRSPAPTIVWQSFKRGEDGCVMFKDGKAFSGRLSAFTEDLGMSSTW